MPGFIIEAFQIAEPPESYILMLMNRLTIYGWEVSYSDVEMMSLKGYCLIATVLDGEVFTTCTRKRLLWFSWANGKDTAWQEQKHLSRSMLDII